MKDIFESNTAASSQKKIIAFAPVLAIILSMFLYAFFAKPIIERHTWKLSLAKQAEPFLVVAYDPDYDFSDEYDPLFALSKPIELTCEAENGKLIITDKTNGKTYSGTYKVRTRRNPQRYLIVIEGKEGVANISNNSLLYRTLFISIDGYYLNFVAE